MLQSPAGDGTCIPQAARSTIVAKVAFRVRSGCFACGGRDAVIRRCPRPIAPTPGPSPEGEGWRGASTYRGYSSPSPEGEGLGWRSEEHTSELPSLMRISYAVFCLKKKNRMY